MASSIVFSGHRFRSILCSCLFRQFSDMISPSVRRRPNIIITVIILCLSLLLLLLLLLSLLFVIVIIIIVIIIITTIKLIIITTTISTTIHIISIAVISVIVIIIVVTIIVMVLQVSSPRSTSWTAAPTRARCFAAARPPYIVCVVAVSIGGNSCHGRRFLTTEIQSLTIDGNPLL